MNDIDVGRIKQYNEEYKKCKEKAMQLTAERDMNKKEIESLCRELSVELGVDVTPENVGQIYNERVAKINADLALGESIINRIKNEEAQPHNLVQPQQVQQSKPVSQVKPTITPPNMISQQVQPQAPVQQTPVQPVTQAQPVMQQTPVQPVMQPTMPNSTPVMAPPQMGGNGNGFSSLGNIPQAEVRTEPIVENPSPNTGGNAFINQLKNNQAPIIPQMFSRGGGIPSIDESELEDIDVV